MQNVTEQHPLAQSIKQHINDHLDCESIQVLGDGQHFYATIVSEAFMNKSRIERHKLVYEALGQRMKHEIHALSIKALTPQELSKD